MIISDTNGDRIEPRPVTERDLHARLKYISSLLFGLSVDVGAGGIETDETTALEAEIEKLRAELKAEKALPKRRPRSPEEQERHREVMRKYWERKRAEKRAETDESDDDQ